MIVEHIYQHARTHPQRRAVVWNGLSVTYRRFAQAIQTARSGWQTQALPTDSVAVVIVHSLLECWPCVLALQSLGLRTVCAPSLQAARALGLRNVSCFVLCQNKEQVPGCREELVHWQKLRRLPLPASLYALAPDSALPQFASGTHAGGHILFSSGTTGSYKKLFHDGALDEERCARRAAAEGIGADSVSHTVNFGLWTATGYRRPLVSWHAGGCVVFDQRAAWPLHLREHGITHLMLVPAMVSEAIEMLRRAKTPARPAAFELIVGGAPLSASVLPAVFEYLTPNLSITFGSTELWLSALRSAVRNTDELHWLLPWQGRELQVVTESGQPCTEGTEGVLRVKLTPLDYSNYLDAPDTSARMFRDGWFYPGDFVVRRADGRIRVLGRTADVVNLNGRKVASGPIEDAVRAALGAEAVCAFSGVDNAGESLVVLAVEITPPATAQQLQQAAAGIADLKNVRFVQLPRFPRTQTGTQKIDRITLRRQVMSMQTRNSSPP